MKTCCSFAVVGNRKVHATVVKASITSTGLPGARLGMKMSKTIRIELRFWSDSSTPSEWENRFSNSVELKNAGLDERCRRSSIRKESGLLSECEPNVLEVVDVKMRNKKTIQVMFDNEVAFENAPKRVVSRRDEIDEDAILMLEMLLDGRKMRFQLRNGCLDSFDVSHLKSIRAITVPLCNPCLPNRCSDRGKRPRRVRPFGGLFAYDFSVS